MRTLTSSLIAAEAIAARAALAGALDDDANETSSVLLGPQVEDSTHFHPDEEFTADVLTVRSWPVQVTGMIYPLPIVYDAMGAGWYMTTLDFDPDVPLFDDDTLAG